MTCAARLGCSILGDEIIVKTPLQARLLPTVAILGLLIAACGSDGTDASGSVAGSAGTPESPRVVEMEMTDIAFAPTTLDVTAGETVKFVFVNNGKIKHEAIFGDESEQAAHGEEMADMAADDADMDMSGDDADMDMSGDAAGMDGDFALEPGMSDELIMTFGAAGSTVIGCHEPGHWEAGMRVNVSIKPLNTRATGAAIESPWV